MKQSFSGLNEIVVTFSGAVSVEDIITIGENGMVSKATAEKDIIGVCVSKNADIAGVMIRGAVELNYTGTAPTVGNTSLATAGNNYIKTSTTNQEYLVLSVDTIAKTAVVLL